MLQIKLIVLLECESGILSRWSRNKYCSFYENILSWLWSKDRDGDVLGGGKTSTNQKENRLEVDSASHNAQNTWEWNRTT